MTTAEIRQTYETLPAPEAFEALDCDGITPEQVEAVLGEEASREYANWIYETLN